MKSNIAEKKMLVQKVFNKVFDKYDLINENSQGGSHKKANCVKKNIKTYKKN